jgi:hypothetical protein
LTIHFPETRIIQDAAEVAMSGSMQRGGPDHEKPVLPRRFQHQGLLGLSESAKVLHREELVNLINYIHFSDRHVFALFRHQDYDEYVLVRAYPEPCQGAELTCRWDETYCPQQMVSYRLSRLVIPQDSLVVLMPLEGARTMNGFFSLPFPEEGYALTKRRSSRFFCQGVSAELMQSGVRAQGELVDFGAGAFRISTKPVTFKIKSWFNPELPASVRLFSGQGDIFYGSCRCLRRQDDQESEDIVFAAENDKITRFQPKKIRNPRRRIMPSPVAVFSHPFFRRKIHRDIFDLSTTGFSIRDDADEALLMPGMMIDNLSIIHAGVAIAHCTGQIIYRREEPGAALYGVAILDMDIHSYSRINQLLSAHADPHISVSTEVDMDALWEFFFQTGFIYPTKYGFFQTYRKDYLETYRKLYQDNPDMARHITYEEKGKIYGHMSMVRAYERAWLIQHHAARPMGNKMPGYVVLRHMILFLHGAYTLPSVKMDYVMCYYRPENKFPDRVFGGFARSLENPKGCSLDLFSYLTVPSKTASKPLPKGWRLDEISLPEMWELDHFYRRTSGGLFLDVLKKSLEPGETSLREASEGAGMKRKWSFYGLFHDHRPICVLIVNQSDFGLNLSEILNSITAMVIEADLLPWETLLSAVSQLAAVYGTDRVPLFIYPEQYMASKGLPCEKRYSMWIVDMHYSNLFLEFVQRKFRMKYE